LAKENTIDEWLELLTWSFNNKDKLQGIATKANQMTKEEFMTDSHSSDHINEEIFTYAFN